MKSKVLAVLLFSTLPVLGIITLFFIDAREKERFAKTIDRIRAEASMEDIAKALNATPAVLASPEKEDLFSYGLQMLPESVDPQKCLVVIFPWNGIPHRYIFVFADLVTTGIVAVSYGKM
jgi:hypothetical protein